ncbi:MAG: PhzF family phenazine biosynthesis protein [Acetobacteraceae bacterium]
MRYFAPESEVPFCGHATIALGAALALAHGDGVFALSLNDARITVEGRRDGATIAAALQSPPTSSRAASRPLIADALAPVPPMRRTISTCGCPPAIVNAGANHLLLALNSREKLRAMGVCSRRRPGLDEGTPSS